MLTSNLASLQLYLHLLQPQEQTYCQHHENKLYVISYFNLIYLTQELNEKSLLASFFPKRGNELTLGISFNYEYLMTKSCNISCGFQNNEVQVFQ